MPPKQTRQVPILPCSLFATVMLGLLLSSVPLFAFSVTVTAGSSLRADHSLVAGAWYTGWHATEGFPLSEVSWDKYNTLYYSFA
ncbi:hypothetical protein BJ138DRAFT_1131554 [Hygrophoropsis aurantiaca]|nr:hypothetical protein BJ138DRAFT_1131554 [Hygrophoropsis aurantiaca]